MAYEKKKKCSNCSQLLKRQIRPNYFRISRSYRSKVNKIIFQKLQQIAMYAKSFGIGLMPCNFRKLENINSYDFNAEDIQVLEKNTARKTPFLFCKAKSLSMISRRKYLSFRKETQIEMSSIYKIRKVERKINEIFNFETNKYGYYINPAEKLNYILKQTLKIMETKKEVLKDDTFIVKFAGDGTNITRSRLQVLNFTVTVIDSKSTAMSIKGNHILGIFKIDKESYESLNGSLKELLMLIKSLNEIEIDGKKYKLKKYMGGDLKFLSLLYGINAANSNFSCLWCKCNIKEKISDEDMDKFWPINRSLKEALKLCKHKDAYLRMGYINKPLVIFIEFECVIIDLLHMYLRITDKFMEILLDELIKLDGLDSTKADLDERPNFQRLINFIETTCKVTKPFYTSSKDAFKYKMRSFNGNERKIILENLIETKIKKIFPNMEKYKALNINFIFKEFLSSISKIKKNEINNENVGDFKDKLKIWQKLYMKLAPSEDHELTPYIHSYINHLPEFIIKYGNINLFNVQGLEKLNDQITKVYHGATNKHKLNNKFILQMLKTRNRIEFFELNGEENEIQN